jgi:hypothetical protein
VIEKEGGEEEEEDKVVLMRESCECPTGVASKR